ncbi:MAG: hypothetical protein GTO40_08050 [Deltaproteobacteria bacterium]|nr:hypothetical protein [Deltaproteobacteria bacterium]
MKKTMTLMVLLVMTLLPMSSNPIHSEEQLAWDICVKDVLYIAEYQFNLEAGNVLRGQALAPGPSFPAPLTGYYNPIQNTASFSIGYLNDNSRHYWIDVATLAGVSWGIRGSDSTFLDGPRAATLGPCTPVSSKSAEGDTGASE